MDQGHETQQYVNAMIKAWKQSAELRREAEAKGPLKEVYSVHCHVGSICMFEDAEGVFWMDLDGEFSRPEDLGGYEASPRNVSFMRSKSVSEETIQRIVKQCKAGSEERISG